MIRAGTVKNDSKTVSSFPVDEILSPLENSTMQAKTMSCDKKRVIPDGDKENNSHLWDSYEDRNPM